MITVHHEKETDFSKNGYGSIDDYVFGAEVNWELNGQFSAYLEYPTFLDKANNLVNKNILRVPVPFMDDQLFRIYRTRKVLGFIQIEARHIFYDLLDNFIEDTNIVAKNGSQAIDQLLSATQYPHRFQGFSNINTVRNARMVRYNPVEALLDDSQANTFVSRWGGEIVRDNFTIRMYQQMGSDKGVHIQHKKDLTGYEATFDESTVTTRIMPIGFDGLKLPEMYVDSPLIDLDNPKIDTIKYDTVKAAIGEYANAEDAVPLEEAYALLRQYAKEEYSVNHVDEPRATVKVDFVNLHNTKEYEGFESLQAIHQGDTVKISVIDEGFEITSRLVAFKSDPLQKDHYTSTTLGNHVYAFTSSVNSTTQLRNDVEQLKEDVIMAMQSASGKNRNFWGSADPNTLNLNADVGDNYFRANGEETMLYQYVEINGEKYWKQILDTAQLATIQAEVEKAQATANQAKLDASGAYTNAVAEAERLVSASDEVWQGKMTEFDEQVGLIEVSVQSAQTKADNALREVGISTDLAQTAKGLADTAKANAQTAINNAQSALTEAGDAKTTADSLSVKVDDLEGEVELKATQIEVDGISGRVSTAESNISQNATAISARLTSSQVNSLVDGKGLAQVTYVDNQINATAEGFGSELTRVEGKIPSAFSTNNLIAKGDTPYSNTNFLVAEWDLLDTFEDGEDVTVSFRGRTGSSSVSYSFYYGGSSIFLGSHKSIGGWQTEIVNLTFKWKNVGPSGQTPLSQKLHLYSHPAGNSWLMAIDWLVLSRGKLGVTEYMPALSEMVMDDDFTLFKNNYQNTVDGITSELSKTAKLTDLNGMVTESYLATNQYTTQGQINTQLVDYLKTTDLNNKVKETVAYQDIEETTDRYNRIIGTTDAESRTNIAKIAMTDSLFQTTVLDSIESGGRNLLQNTGDFSENTPPLHPSHDGFLSVAGRELRVGRTDRVSKTVFRLSRDIQYGEKITISFIMLPWSSVNSRVRFSIGYSNASPWTDYPTAAGTEHRVEMTITAGNGFSEANYKPNNELWMIINYPFAIVEGSLMVEAGNLASNWTPAPEDKADQSQVTQLADSWALTLKSGDDIKTQINASTSSLRLSSKFIHLNGSSLIDNATIKSAHIDSLNANKIVGNTADFNTIRAGVLTTDAVTATHIKSENALIDTIFSTTALIERLTSKTAFINSIKAMEIDAGKITTGELNAANVRIVNLDVNQLTGNAMNFISGAFTSNAGALSLSGSGMRVNFANGYSLRINGAGTNYYTSGGQVIGGLLTAIPISGATHSLSLAARRGYTVSLDYQGSLSYNQSNRALSVDGTSGNITIERPIYESSGSAGLSFLRSEMGNVGWGLLLRTTKATGSGIFLADNGEVWIGVSGGFKQFT